MKKLVLILMLSFCALKKSSAQKMIHNNSSILERFYFGGNFGFSIGPSSSSIELSPTVGYMITPKFSSGIGFVYQYHQHQTLSKQKFTNNVYGGKIFSRYNLFSNIFALGELEHIRAPYYVVNSSNRYEERETWTTGTFLGAGFFQPLGSGGFSIAVLYNLSYNKTKSPYPEPYVLRMSFAF